MELIIMNTQPTEQFVVAIRRKLDDKIAGFLKIYFFLDNGSVCIQAVNTFQEATRCDRDYMIPIGRDTDVLFDHLQDNLQEHYNISFTPINKEDGTPDFLDREYFDGQHPIYRGEWQHYFHKLAEVCEDIRRPQENGIFYYKAEAEDHIWDDRGNYLPNFIYKPDGFRMQWYKYPLRSCYANRDLTFDVFERMIDACVKSLESRPLKECEVKY
jgi:hypothetical protein